ncbi:unsaturated chondroitin disaccharide hydrolase [Paenibacillus sp. UNCCL117]|uniref:glycoside hydrolase family 88 protein n=1 Tax=unclassified Paenibacillus TaxID=185978 RepID=UPI00088A0644|nr:MULTISPECIES: glycoside hydrolase family 88 protein [unclassified Paenibacillus]SDE18592.1 unsaturated chondroitin disaccharide hydrolase [Paenibacillus sp. cl123]SFW62182.1 unsaturated chondroitin disaccharide hydrolase [Paenibacillus sp. UNCCL117]
MWKQAIEEALRITEANIGRFEGKFPHVSDGGTNYVLNDNREWTDGFWSGILWLAYEYSNKEVFREAAVKTVDSFSRRLEQRVALEHHDIGFLYSLSTKAQWIIEGDEQAKALTVKAADVLLDRWREKTQLLQAWGPKDDPTNGGRIIIDCLLNLPLLYWAAEATGDSRYRELAEIHAHKSRRFLVRGDDSSYHTFYFDQETGDSLRGGTHQGFRDGSTWTRGQAWGIYGFALSYRYLKQPELLETSKRMARYFLDHLPEDGVAYWDFDVPQTPESQRDSSASAIAAAGMLEIADLLPDSDPDKAFFRKAAEDAVTALYEHYSTRGEADAEGFLKHGSYFVRGGISPDDYTIWGDYYYLEALVRLERQLTGYWYERGR